MTLPRTIILLAVIFTFGAWVVSAGPNDETPCRAACVAQIEAH